ncbi:MAG: ubiquitin-protein ligase E3, MARCH family [Amphiamblys sp. WSBS2006]|nr:MAG: ubiquitin-protein ligase E3, MARCH family [Amphiamblys sp. WSBS2006]
MDEGDNRMCWICYSRDGVSDIGEDGQEGDEWVAPCRCCGGTKWVHRTCILGWIDKRQNGNVRYQVSCSQCGERYRLKSTPLLPGGVVFFLEAGHTIVDRVMTIVGVYEVAIAGYSVLFGFGVLTMVGVVGLSETGAFFDVYFTPFFSEVVSKESLWTKEFFGVVSNFIVKILVGVPLATLSVLSSGYRKLFWLNLLLPMVVLFDGRSTPKLPGVFSYEAALFMLPAGVFLYRRLQRSIPRVVCRFLGVSFTDEELEKEKSADALPSVSEAFDDDSAFRVSAVSAAKTLFFPFVSSAVGFLLFRNTGLRRLYRAILGGVVLAVGRDVAVTLRGCNAIYFRKNRAVLCREEKER